MLLRTSDAGNPPVRFDVAGVGDGVMEILERGITVESADDLGGALGTSAGGRIQILNGLSPAEELVVLAHEYAHELLHRADDIKASRYTLLI